MHLKKKKEELLINTVTFKPIYNQAKPVLCVYYHSSEQCQNQEDNSHSFKNTMSENSQLS